jgi:peptidyl-prolyl cis-trans isomerase SurA
MSGKKTLFLLLFLFSSSFSSEQKIDGIAAVIDDEIILISELKAYTVLRLSNLGLKSDSTEFKKYEKQFLNELIDGKVLLVHGKKDSTISVSTQEVEQATNNHIAMLLKQNNLTLDSLKVELKRQQGITLTKFKADARKAIKEQLMKQKVQQAYLYSTKVTKKDVEQFYKEYIDSLPKMGESVKLSKLSLNINPSEKIRQTAFDKIQSIKQKLDSGEDFAKLAEKYSDGPESVSGGDLGFIGKGTLSELVFEEKAFSLQPGQISDPFETRFGFHIINVLEHRDQKVHIRQIFIKIEPPEEEVDAITSKIDSIRTSCTTEKQFSEAVKQFSEDPVTRNNNGKMKWISLLELPAEIKSVIDSLEIGQISKPVRNNRSLSIYRLDDKVSERTLNLENDYLILEKKAKDIFSQKKLIELVSEWRKSFFIDIRI